MTRDFAHRTAATAATNTACLRAHWAAVAARYDAAHGTSGDDLDQLASERDDFILGCHGLVHEDERLRTISLDAVRKLELRTAEFAVDMLRPLPAGALIFDAGCGAGGAALLARKRLDCKVHGCTLSPAQAASAEAMAFRHGHAADGSLHFFVGNMMQVPSFTELGSDSFIYDALMAIESTEHVPDLIDFFQVAKALLRPGAGLVIVASTWAAGEGFWSGTVKRIVDRHNITNLHGRDRYMSSASHHGFELHREEDLTSKVVKYLEYRGISDHRTGSEAFMAEGYRRGLFEYHAFKFLAPGISPDIIDNQDADTKIKCCCCPKACETSSGAYSEKFFCDSFGWIFQVLPGLRWKPPPYLQNTPKQIISISKCRVPWRPEFSNFAGLLFDGY